MEMAKKRAGSFGRTCCNLALACAALPALAFATALPAQADFCMQLNGGSFSGDLGFFRFHGNMPTAPGKIVTLRGRVAGLSPVFGAATVATDGSYVELGATFFADADEGQIDVTFSPPRSDTGSGDGDYGQYGTGGGSFDASIVNCALEPERKMRPRARH
jgi:hypothetical protein